MTDLHDLHGDDQTQARTTRAVPDKAKDHARDLIEFVQASPSSFHAASEVVARLSTAGATVVDEARQWPSAPGAYVMRRDGAAVAWIVPDNPQDISGFRIVGSHTDSPGFRVKPNPRASSVGYAQVAVEVYGGALLASWTDREIEFAGRVIDREGREHLARTGPVARIPQLAIHMNRGVNEEGLKLHRQYETTPVIGLETFGADVFDTIAAAAGLERDDIVAWDLISCDTQVPRTFGTHGEFLACARLDNLLSVHSSLVAFEALLAEGASDLRTIPVLVAFDHEEVGSATTTGAAGPLLSDVLTRIAAGLGADLERTQQLYRGSVCLSADGAHGVHPNYVAEHEPGHRPQLNEGPVIKVNANQRYATTAAGQAEVVRIAEAASARVGQTIPVQTFVSANHKPCGSTIGPITATRLGIDTVDIGAAMLSMHSAREMCGTVDPWWLAEISREFWVS
nr:M18 family aminopeptidase [Corynebacterium lactis]